ncbi:MAG: hypothetical protein GXO36_06515 [Chloroflexi bacterium]|nr:hypothetical protein [Chloroflexota bacterium]
MDWLLHPDVAYVLLVLGIALGVLAVVTPGTGFLEIAALVSLGLAGYAMLYLPLNPWAFGLLAVALAAFVQSVRRPKQRLWSALAVAAFILGSVFLFRTPGRWLGVHPLTAVLTSLSFGTFFWFVVRKALEALQRPPMQSLDALIGQIGETRTEVHHTGTVYVAGELWSARSVCPIPPGKEVRVIGREGFVLLVEPVHEPKVAC